MFYAKQNFKNGDVLTAEHLNTMEDGIVAACGNGPLLLDVDNADIYLENSSYGDEALEAIKNNRQILVKVPNADGGVYTAIYSPVMMYQIPNFENKYLYLFFLRDEKNDLSQVVGYSIQIPTYGQLKMLLSQEYNSNPLES